MTTVDLDGCHIEKVQIVGPVLTLPQPLVDHCPAEVTFTRHWATAEQIQEKLHDFWEPRWWKNLIAHSFRLATSSGFQCSASSSDPSSP